MTPDEAAEWLRQVPLDVLSGELAPYDLTESPRYLVEWPAGLPHDPMWNLIPRSSHAVPWECSWHGTVSELHCAECRREHAEYQATGTWEDRRPSGTAP